MFLTDQIEEDDLMQHKYVFMIIEEKTIDIICTS